MVELLKANNPNCFLVTGHPRTPRDQGLVESANKLVQGVLKSISAERRLKGLKVNWTNLLGQIMAVCNSQTGMKSLSTSSMISYESVFSQQYHPVLQCTVAEMHDCVSTFQRLKLSPDERLENYVKDHDIVDIDVADGRGRNVQISKEDSEDVDDANESEGDEINDDTFPDCEEDNVILCKEIKETDTSICNTMDYASEHAAIIKNIDGTTDVTLDKGMKNAGATVPLVKKINVDTGCDEYKVTGTKSDSRPYLTLDLRAAWDNGNIACPDYPLSHHNTKKFNLIMPTLTCGLCCHVGVKKKQGITVHDKDYVESIRSSTKWWDSVFIGSFAQMASHYAHTTMNEHRSALDDNPLPQVMHVTYPNEPITKDQLVTFPSNVTQVVSVVHQSQHYAVLEIDIPRRRAVIFDGLNKPLLQGIDHVISSLKCTWLI